MVYILGTIYFPGFLFHGVLPFCIFLVFSWLFLIIVHQCKCDTCKGCGSVINYISRAFHCGWSDGDCNFNGPSCDDDCGVVCCLCIPIVIIIGLIWSIWAILKCAYQCLPRKVADTMRYSFIFTFIAFGLIWCAEFIPIYVSQEYGQYVNRDFNSWWNREDTLETWQTITIWMLAQLS